MTSAAQAVKDFMGKPFELYFMRGKQFTIIENLPITKDLREVEEINKWNKKESVVFMRIEQGLFQKDLRMTKSEFMEFSLCIPKGIENLQGLMFEVDQNNSKIVKYIGSTAQDLNGNSLLGTNTPATGQSAPISQPQQPQDQKSLFMTKMIGSMRVLESAKVPVDTKRLMDMCEAMSPGNALELIAAAKSQGLIVESQGIFRVIE